ncbi:membrane-anchored junction protein isoform X2 [Trachinotus anak]|uniref:membrane-anchored junction protein isoform X2 n=1 Tax=Trachinotus anak TaxID=443729 RepID=UPI0039F1ED93
MTLQTFYFPLAGTRLFKAGNLIFKFRIRGGSTYSGEDVIGCLNEELEDIVRTVLGNLDNLQPFFSVHFIIFPYKSRWERLPRVMCKHCEKKLRVYPFILILYLEKNMQSEKQAEEKLNAEKGRAQHFSRSEPQSKRCRTDSPLEEAILKALLDDLEAEGEVSLVGLHGEDPHGEEEVTEHPRHKENEGFDKPSHQVNLNTGSGSPGEVQDMGEKEKAEPRRPGILSRLASRVFPFSLFFKDS